jgi:ketosteroid isomerase-like protein
MRFTGWSVAFLLAAAPAFAGDAPMPADQAAMVAAERAFVQLAAEKGFRDSFYRYFAPDGIAFGPHPFRTRVALERQPSSPGPMGAIWAPVWGDISQAGDLGWNTGPLLFEARPAQNRPERHGMFFSVWEKQADGSWLVVLDLGSDTPGPVVPLDTPYQTSWRAGDRMTAGGDPAAALLAAERALLADMGKGIGAAYLKYLADDARVHRPGVMPVVGRESLADWAARETQVLTGEPLLARAARSGDLGYTYGSYVSGGDEPAAGYYARVWKRDAAGRWRVVMDTVSPLPAGVAPLPPALLAPEELFLAEDWAGAAALYQAYLKDHPDNAFAWHRLGASQVNLRQLPEAIANLQKAVAVGGGTAVDHYNLACAYALSGRADEALAHVEKAIAAGMRNRRQYEADEDLASLRELARFKAMMQAL